MTHDIEKHIQYLYSKLTFCELCKVLKGTFYNLKNKLVRARSRTNPYYLGHSCAEMFSLICPCASSISTLAKNGPAKIFLSKWKMQTVKNMLCNRYIFPCQYY